MFDFEDNFIYETLFAKKLLLIFKDAHLSIFDTDQCTDQVFMKSEIEDNLGFGFFSEGMRKQQTYILVIGIFGMYFF